jgi:hypothetical protein
MRTTRRRNKVLSLATSTGAHTGVVVTLDEIHLKPTHQANLEVGGFGVIHGLSRRSVWA